MTAIVIVSHILYDRLIEKCKSIRKKVPQCAHIYLVMQSDNPVDIEMSDEIKTVTYSYQDLCDLGYNAIFETVVPGSAHFVLLKFYQEHPGYDYYWNIEYDVEFDGDWSLLFDTCSRYDTDFITCDIQDFDQNPYWHWWNFLSLQQFRIPIIHRTRSFNPVYRLSAKALEMVCHRQSEGDGGHHEVLLPTLLKSYGFSLGDLNRKSRYALPGLKTDFYNKNYPQPYGSMRHAPVIPRSILTGHSNLLFHPLKE